MSVPIQRNNALVQPAKAAHTTSDCDLTGGSLNLQVGWLLVAQLVMDPAAGSVTFSKLSGTATVGSWTILDDVSNGSGTSGARIVTAWAFVTGAGTTCVIRATHPSVSCSVMFIGVLSNVDQTTPIADHQATNSGSFPAVTPPAGGDVYVYSVGGFEATAGAAVTYSESGQTGFTGDTQASPTWGTTGGGSASNISMSERGWYKAGATATSYTPSASTSSAVKVASNILIQAPVATPLTQSADDNVGLTDPAPTVERTLGQSQTDSAGLGGETFVFSHDWVRPLTPDTVGLTDNVAFTTGLTRPTTDDTTGLTDNIAKEVVLGQKTDVVGLTDPAVTTALVRTQQLDDTTGLTDSTTRATAFALTINDSAGLSDALSTAGVYSTTITDTTGLTDNRSAGVVLGAITDTTGLTDSAAQAAGYGRAINDPAGLSDLATTSAAMALAATDTTGLTDAASTATTFSLTITDSTGLTDPAPTTLRTINFSTSTDNVGLTDDKNFGGSQTTTLDDSTGLTDAASPAAAFTLTLNDPAAQPSDSDAFAGAGGFLAGKLTDVGGRAWGTTPGTWSYAGGVAYNNYNSGFSYAYFDYGRLHIRQSVAIARVAGRVNGLHARADGLRHLKIGVVTDAVSSANDRIWMDLVDSTTESVLNEASAAPNPWVSGDVLTVEVQGDTIRVYQNSTKMIEVNWPGLPQGTLVGLYANYSIDVAYSSYSVTDIPVNITDSASPAAGFVRSITDPAGLTDSRGADVAPGAITDTTGLTDNNSRVAAFASNPTDTTGLTDAASTATTFSLTINDSTGLTDSATPAAGFVRSATDTAGLTDSAAPAALFGVTATDNVNPTDSTSRTTNFVLTATDAVNPTDAAATATAYALTVNDNAGLTDSVATVTTFVRTVDDPAGLTDVASPVTGFSRTVDDDAGLTDSTQRYRFYMATLPPDAIIASTGLAGAVTDIQEDPSTSDANYLTGSGAVTLKVSFPSPPGQLLDGTDIQHFRIRARKGS